MPTISINIKSLRVVINSNNEFSIEKTHGFYEVNIRLIILTWKQDIWQVLT